MRRANRSKDDEKWLAALGVRLGKLIEQKGYKSVYDFWIQAVGDEVSRASLNYILNGKVDVKISTLRKLADGLEIDLKTLLDFRVR